MKRKRKTGPVPVSRVRVTAREIRECMRHDSHRRISGRIRQVRWA